MFDLSRVRLDAALEAPIYRQLAGRIAAMIESRALVGGERLPPTRELAGQLRLNRTTVSAAYALLEEAGQIEGQVGRGSFVAVRDSAELTAAAAQPRDWETILPPSGSGWNTPGLNNSAHKIEISFASSRPAENDFPMTEFRILSKQVIDSPEASEILQLGSSRGYLPLRRYLLEEALASGVARSGDDIVITNGCQQALDLLARVFASPASAVALEDPVYHGMLQVFSRSGAEVVGVKVDDAGMDPHALEQVLIRHRPRLLIVTPSFQNPTGASLPVDRRNHIVALAGHFGCVLVEIDIYSQLRYRGDQLPTLKELDCSGNTILIRSYSKVAFPGLRVGWVVGPKPVIARLSEAKEISDLHSDQLSQAVLLRFAKSGELARHLQRTRLAGAGRLHAVLEACSRFLPSGSRYTRPDGGMSLWIELPLPLTAEGVLSRAQERGVAYLPGRHFSARRSHERGLRISFGGLPPGQITRGIQLLGEAARCELAARNDFEPAAALV